MALLGVNVAQSIGDKIEYLFVPDTVAMNGYISQIEACFAWKLDIEEAFNAIKTYLTNTTAIIPKISIDLTNAESKYDYGNTTFVLDMTWYSRYKPTVDVLIIAITYIWFVFVVFRRLPAIIMGSEAVGTPILGIKNNEIKQDGLSEDTGMSFYDYLERYGGKK